MITKKLLDEFSKYCIEKHWEFNPEFTSEFTFQFRLSRFLDNLFPNKYNIELESNIKRHNMSGLHKKEIDIDIFNIKTETRHGIEIKFIKDMGAYDIGLYKTCEDVRFLEEMQEYEGSGFKECYSIIFTTLPIVHEQPKNGKFRARGKRIRLYECFRKDKLISGTIYRKEGSEVKIRGEYKLEWFDFTNEIDACILKIDCK